MCKSYAVAITNHALVNCKLSVTTRPASNDSGKPPCSRGLQTRRLVICPTCEQVQQRQRPQSCITLALALTGLRPSPVDPTIDQLPDRAVLTFPDISMSLARFCFGQYIIFSCAFGITHHAKVPRKLSNP